MGAKNNDNLVWIDMEMTGLDPETCKVLEIATIVTDPQLNVIAEGPVIAVHQSDAILDGMDEWVPGYMARVVLPSVVVTVSLMKMPRLNKPLPFWPGTLMPANHRCV